MGTLISALRHVLGVDRVWICETWHLNGWTDEGFRRMDAFHDGAAASLGLAMDTTKWCSDAPVRWFRTKTYAEFIGRHRGDREHFHVIHLRSIADGRNEHGQPIRRTA